jgi:hypothetical protein
MSGEPRLDGVPFVRVSVCGDHRHTAREVETKEGESPQRLGAFVWLCVYGAYRMTSYVIGHMKCAGTASSSSAAPPSPPPPPAPAPSASACFSALLLLLICAAAAITFHSLLLPSSTLLRRSTEAEAEAEAGAVGGEDSRCKLDTEEATAAERQELGLATEAKPEAEAEVGERTTEAAAEEEDRASCSGGVGVTANEPLKEEGAAES